MNRVLKNKYIKFDRDFFKNGFNYKVTWFSRKIGNNYNTNIKIETTINNVDDMELFIKSCIPKNWITNNRKNQRKNIKITHNIDISSNYDIKKSNFLLLRSKSVILIRK